VRDKRMKWNTHMANSSINIAAIYLDAGQSIPTGFWGGSRDRQGEREMVSGIIAVLEELELFLSVIALRVASSWKNISEGFGSIENFFLIPSLVRE
jgi:hypothetical protein